jgi:hypothetical protein
MGPLGKKLYPFVILIAVAIGIFWGMYSRRHGATESASPASREIPKQASNAVPETRQRTKQPVTITNSATDAVAQQVQSPAAPTLPKGPDAPYLIGSAEAPPQMDPMTLLGNVRHVINDYGSMFGGNPVGTNPEITAALSGDNPKGVKFLRDDFGMRVNGAGELVDAWGTPLFFHQISGTEMEIRSAGPDRKMYTGDDLVTK